MVSIEEQLKAAKDALVTIEAQPVAKPYEFRVPRLPYLLWSVTTLVVMALLISLTVDLIFRAGGFDETWQVSMSIFPLELLIFWVVYFILAVGRFHDIGSSGWWSLLLLVPVVNLIVWAYLLFAPSAVRKEAQLALQFPRPKEPPRAERVAAMTNARGWMIFAGLIISCLLVASAVVLFATYYVAA